MKVIVIGCTHAGTAAIANLKKKNPEVQVTIYERNNTISFLSCGIALYIGGVVKDPQGLFYSSPEAMAKLGVITKMKHDVIDVDFIKKQVTVKNLISGEELVDLYDKLIITSGSWPVIPDLPGIALQNVLLAKNYDHANQIIEKVKNVNHITVVGAGYIGVELVEAFRTQGKQVALIDGAERILSKYLDQHFTDIAEQSLLENGIRLILGESITGFEGKDGNVGTVTTNKGRYQTDLVILCIGFHPNTGLFGGKLDMLPNGAIKVNEFMQTNLPDVFAAGDCCAVVFNPTGKHDYIPLATNAVRMGTLVGLNIMQPTVSYMGTQGTSGIKIYGWNIAATGMTEDNARAMALDIQTSMLIDNYRPEFMPESQPVHLKVVYETASRRILGAQILSKVDLTQSINTLSVCIQNKMTIDQLAFVDFFFQPHFNKPWNFLNSVALNTL
ncbi:MAG TPA: NADH oxidase [Firmicutes bacterium]|jgi:NADPH-dependent 2,4-dienoyl-CoA reductase/sulfur reductase-like enzyme|nr:NADH oxidase [Bacillota bacterium]